MATINLLPWREELREQRKLEFLIMLGVSAGIAIFIIAILHFVMLHHINHQTSRNAILTQEIRLLDAKIREIQSLKKLKAALIARMEIIQQLQLDRPKVVHLFDEVVKILPKGVHLSEISRNGNRVKIQGFADSNMNISRLMRNIETSVWLNQPLLSEIKTDDVENKRVSEFSLDSLLIDPKDTKKEMPRAQ